jgi:hypothetical protein
MAELPSILMLPPVTRPTIVSMISLPFIFSKLLIKAVILILIALIGYSLS